MKDWLQDRMRHPRREQTKIHTDRLNIGQLHVRESQVFDSVAFHCGEREANLGREEVLRLIEWLQSWSMNQVAVKP